MKQHNSAVIKKDAAQFDKWCFQQSCGTGTYKDENWKIPNSEMETPSEGVRIPEAEIRDGEES